MIKRFNDYISENAGNEEFLKKYHNEWLEKYPELRMFKLEAGDINNSIIWFYSLNKTINHCDIDIFIEIKKGKSWSINFELSRVFTEDISSSEEEHLTKNGLDYNSLKIQLTRLFTFIREWNVEVYDKENYFPLIDSLNIEETIDSSIRKGYIFKNKII